MTEITRQHLEDAALAAGVLVDWDHGRKCMRATTPISGTALFDCWRPDTDGGDAFRLMIKMQMRVEILPCWATAVIDGEEENGMRYDAPEGLPRAARTVIVLCAAAVGERMREGGR
jgi:hypothetical protein